MKIIESVIRAHQYLYYVLGEPVLSDREYDDLCRRNNVFGGGGSDRASDYTLEERQLAELLRSKACL